MPGSSRDHRPIRPGEHQRARRAPHGVVCTSTSIHHDHRAPVLGFKSKGTGPTSTRIELIRTLRCLRVVKRWQLPRHSASWANAIRHARTYASDAGSTRPACALPRKSEPARHEPTPDRHAGRPPAARDAGELPGAVTHKPPLAMRRFYDGSRIVMPPTAMTYSFACSSNRTE
jgi:hypothetical protein